MSDWPSVPLGNVLQRRRDEIDVQDVEIYKRLTIRMNGRGIAIRDVAHGSQIGTKRQFVAKSGQLILSKIDARNGAFGIVPPECDKAIITGNFWTFDTDPIRLDARFLNYLTMSPLFVDFCVRASEGTTNRRYLQEPKFLAQRIDLPHVDEQRRIVARIEGLAGKVAEATRLQKETTKQMDALCRALILTPSDGVLVPTDMNELLTMREPDVKVDTAVSYHFAGVYCFGRGVFAGQRKDGSEFAYRSLTRIQRGNFVYPKLMAWEGALGIVPESCDGLYVSPEFPVFEVRKDRVLPEVLDTYFRMPSVWPELAAISTGTNVRRRRLHPRAFLHYKLPLPSMKVQRQFSRVRMSIEQAKLVKRESTRQLDTLMPSILSKAFRGEL